MSEQTVYETAYAKINLHLEVGHKRVDGFHNIESIFQTISLADVLQVRLSRCFSVECLNFNLPAENSLKKAYEVFCEFTGFSGNVDMLLLKRIPTCAGLGGASTDAVALLRALQRLSGFPLSSELLEKMALRIGSDCPFFIKGGTAYVSGRGEVVESLISKKAYGVLVYPNVECETVKAYSLLDEMRTRGKIFTYESCSIEAELEQKRALIIEEYKNLKRSWKGITFKNDFESVAFSGSDEVFKAKQALYDLGAEFSLMTGSGSVVFGLFTDVEMLNRAVKSLKKVYDFCEPFLFC